MMAALPMQKAMTENSEAAMRLAALGLHVFPCQPDKRPQPGLQWAALSSNDPKQVRRWWQRYPAALPAVDCGRSNIFVVDLDRHPGGADGVDAFARLCDEHEAYDLMRQVPAVATAGGGLHLLFAMPTEPLGNRAGHPAAGIDIRGKGGYVIGEGATREDGSAWHAAGDEPGLVEWLESGKPLPALPGWLLAILRAEKQRSTSLPAPVGGIGQNIGQRERAAFATALQAECRKVETTPAGGRNEALNRAAFNLGQMVASGWGEVGEVFAGLSQAARAAGLPQTEAAKTILSGIKAGRAQPRPPLAERERQPVARATMDPSPLLAGSVGQAEGVALAPSPAAIEALPFHWIDPAGIPPRRWLYGKHLIRGFVSATVAPGGVGKSALTMAEGVAIATGRPILGITPAEQVPVWLLNLEDPMDELYRRLMAIALHYGLTEHDLAPGRFYVNSGRETPLIIAESTRDGIRIARPVIEEVKAQIAAKGIGLMIIDPFVASHRVQENDNPAINAVASAWREIAEATGCAIELVHHTRKTGGIEVTVEDARGGNALHGAVRSMRAINGMTKDEAARFGVDNHRQFFRVDMSGKANLAPASANADWFQIVSLDLGNATPDRPSDHVGVVERWVLPDPLEGITADHVGRVQSALMAGGNHRRDPQASDWVGHLVGRVIGVDTGPGLRGASLSASHRAGRAKVSHLVSKWIAAGALREERGLDAKRNERVFVVAGDVGGSEFATP